MSLAKILQTRLGVYAAIAASIVAISGAAAGAWNIADKLEVRPVVLGEYRIAQLEQNQILKGLVETQQQTIEQLNYWRWQQLDDAKQKNGGILNGTDLREYCQLYHQLQLQFRVPECN